MGLWQGYKPTKEGLRMKKLIIITLIIIGLFLIHLRLLEVEQARCGVWRWKVCQEMEGR